MKVVHPECSFCSFDCPGTSCCHSADLHFLLVPVDGPRLTLRAIGKNGQPIPRKPLSDIPPPGPERTITL